MRATWCERDIRELPAEYGPRARLPDLQQIGAELPRKCSSYTSRKSYYTLSRALLTVFSNGYPARTLPC